VKLAGLDRVSSDAKRKHLSSLQAYSPTGVFRCHLLCVLDAGMRKYRGRVSFRPVDEYQPRQTGQSTVASLPCRLDGAKDDCRSDGDAQVDPAGLRTPGGTALTDLPPLSSPVPPDWVTLEDDFVLVIALGISHVGQGVIVAPRSKLADGVINLAMVRAPISRVRLIKLYLAMQDGGEDPDLEVVRVTGFRLEPLDQQEGSLTVDGELVDYGSVQGQVVPSVARVMSLAKD